MMYFNSILNHNNTGNKNTIMETILKNIKDLRNEFSVSEFCVDGHPEFSNSMSVIDNEKMGNIDNIKALHRRYQLLAESNNSKDISKALSPTPDDNCSYYSSDMDTGRNQYEYSSNWLSKFNQRHRESQDSGHSSPDDSRASSPSYSRILSSQSPTPISSDDGIDMIIDSHNIDDDTQLLPEKTPEKDEWQMVPKKAVRTGSTPQTSSFCPARALCSKGNKCKDKHTQKEKELFEARKTAKTANDKEFSDTKFRTELCNKVNVPHNRKMCRFAHGVEQLVCKGCFEVGHKKEACLKVEKEINQSPIRGQ